MNRLPRLLVPAMVAALLLVALPGSTVTAAKPGLTGLGATGQTSATVGELATLRLRLPASVAAFEGRVLAAPGAVEVVGVAPLKGGTGLRPEDTGDGIAIGAWNLGGARRGTVVNVAVAPLVEGRIQLRVVIDAASDAQGRRVQLAADTVLATITAGDGARVITAPVVRRDPAPRAKAQKPRDLRADRRFTRADVDVARAAWAGAHADAAAICDGRGDGDANGDGCVDIVDLQLLHASQGLKVTAETSSTPVQGPALPAARAVGGATLDITDADDFVAVRTFTVDSTADTADATPGNGVCADSLGRCTLRAAMTEADYMQGNDRIAFNLPGTAPVTIQLTSRLPIIASSSGGVFIDAFSQPGASPNTAEFGSNAVPGVYLRGNGNSAREVGFFVTSANNVIRGFAMGNIWRGMVFDGASSTGNLVIGNWMGFTGAGTNAGGSIGILLNVGAHHNTIGTPDIGDRNVIGNYPVAIDVYGAGVVGTVFQNNQFCISPTGALATCNVAIDHNFGPKDELIGGSGPNEKNVMGPTNYQGIELSHGYDNVTKEFTSLYLIEDIEVIGNWVGFRMDGTYDPAYRSGLRFSSADNAQGINVYDGVYDNTIEGNWVASVYDGIILRSPHASGNVFRDNTIGLAPNGGGAAPLTGYGFKIGWSASQNLVEDNVIANAAKGGIGLVNTTNSGLPQAPPYNIKLSRNLVSATNGPAIDLYGVLGPDPNDVGDADQGANTLLNTPVITGLSTTAVSGTGQPTATVEVYRVDRPAGQYGLPQAYLGSAVVAGNGTWTLNVPLVPTDVVSAIQILPDWNTSEFAANVAFTAPAITSASSTTFPAGVGGSFTVTATGNPTPAITASGALPSGVTLTDNGDGTATLAGIPPTDEDGTYPLVITAANGVSPDAVAPFTLTVLPAVSTPPTITSADTVTFVTGEAGTFTIVSTGVPTPTVTRTGALPAGVTLVDNGDGTATLSGTPEAGTDGAYPLTITAANGVNPDAVQSFTLDVDAPPAITSADEATFAAGEPGTFTVTTTGRPAPDLDRSGSLPAGVTFADNGDGTATISGTPSVAGAGTWPITITAANGVGSDATQSFVLTVTAAPAFTSPNGVVFTIGSAGSFDITTTGYPAASVTHAGALPGGITLTDNGDGTATLAGTPAGGTSGTWPLTLTASNGIAPDASQPFAISITAPSDYAADTFGRVVRNNWGTADLGGLWSVSTARAFEVDGSMATMEVGKGQTRWATLSAVAARDVDLRLTFGPSVVPNGGNAFEYLVARQVSTGNEYRAKIRIAASGAVFVQLLRTASGTETTISPEVQVAGLTATPGLSLKARLRVNGVSPTTLDLKVWAAAGAEPGAWNVTATDSTAALQAQGAVGVRAYVASGVTQSSIVFQHDDFAALVP